MRVLVTVSTLAATAQASTVRIGLDITSAARSNPLGAVVGSVTNAGTGAEIR